MGHDRKKDIESIVPYNKSFSGDDKKKHIFGGTFVCFYFFSGGGGVLHLLPDMFFNQGSSV